MKKKVNGPKIYSKVAELVEGKYFSKYFMTKLLFLISSILDLNRYMYVNAYLLRRFKYFNIHFVFKILFLISVDCIFRASVAAVILVLNQKQGYLLSLLPEP